MGLVQALYMYCEEFSEKTGIRTDFISAGLTSIHFDFQTEINLYRLVQEGINNVRKHADATHVDVKPVKIFPHIVLRIQDNGKGFDVAERRRNTNPEKRMGLRSMEERVNLLRGQMSIQSKLTKGTRIFIKIPYMEKDNV
jgi:signal transduction histidine kinase